MNNTFVVFEQLPDRYIHFYKWVKYTYIHISTNTFAKKIEASN